MSTDDDGTVTVLEEYIDGISLARLLKQRRLSDRETRRIMLRLCAALQELHTHNIVHRDIKPDNIILRGEMVYLVDFDAARLYEPGSDTDTQILGTVGYAAPEQFGIYQSDKRSDLYAMGVLLNVMSTGKHPSVGKLVKGPLRKIIQRCTMVNPDDRYQSAAQLMRELRLSSWRSVVFATLAAALAAAVLLTVGLVRRGGDDALEPSDNAVFTPDVTIEATPSPVVPSPSPVVPSPEPIVSSPEPVVPSPEPVVPSPEPVVPSPEPVGPSTELAASDSKPDAIDYKPEQWTELPIDKWINLPYSTMLFRDNGKPSEGITFERMLGKMLANGDTVVRVEYKAEQMFSCTVFSPPGNRLREITGIDTWTTSLEVTLTTEELLQVDNLTFNFHNQMGAITDTPESRENTYNRNMIFVQGYVLNLLRKGGEGSPSSQQPPDQSWQQLPFEAHYTRPNGEPGEGVHFESVYAKIDGQTVSFCVYLTLEQQFVGLAYEPPDKRWSHVFSAIYPGQSPLCFEVPLEELKNMQGLNVALSNDSGRYGITQDEWNRTANSAMILISKAALEDLISQK